MMMSSPLGVAKNLRIAKTVRFKALERGSDDEPVHTDALEQLNSGGRPENERSRRQCVCKHRGGRHDCGAGDGSGRRTRAGVQDVMASAIKWRAALVVSRCAHGFVRHLQDVDQLTVEAWMTN